MLDFFYVTDFLGAFRDERKAHYFYPSVNRDFDVICIRNYGEAHFFSQGKTYQVREGQVVLIPRGVEYAQRGELDECIVAIHFLADHPPADQITVFDTRELSEIEATFNQIYSRYQASGYQVDAVLLSKFYYLLHFFFALPCQTPLNTRILAFFDAHYNSVDFSVGEWAYSLGISRTHLQNFCLKNLHTTPCAYLQKRRLEDAKMILSLTGEKIKDIAKMCGYYSEKRFSTAFRSYTGYSPKEYRDRYAR